MNLEIIYSLSHPPGNTVTLYSILNRCCSRAGSRLLRMNLLQPLTELQTIKDRHTVIHILLRSNSNVYGNLQKSLQSLPDVDRILSSVTQISLLCLISACTNSRNCRRQSGGILFGSFTEHEESIGQNSSTLWNY